MSEQELTIHCDLTFSPLLSSENGYSKILLCIIVRRDANDSLWPNF
jgi:hypothetical protein